MPLNYFTIFFITFVLSIALTVLIRRMALRLNIVDVPDKERKMHSHPTPLLGGVAIFLAVFLMFYFLRGQLLAGTLQASHWIGVFVGSLVLMVGGYLDDKHNLRPSRQIFFPLLAIVAVIVGGVSIEKISNPLGGIVYLQNLSAVLIAIWLLGMMYTTKLLDGLDGLVTGVTAIGAFVIFLFTISERYYQPDIATAALILTAACLGFIIFNWHPATIFLGEGGSLFLGFLLGVLAIISGGKIAIALLVMGVPILDVAWTLVRRLSAGKNPFKFADRKHLHFRLIDLGLGYRTTVLIFYVLALIFGLSALFLQSRGKLLALGVLFLVMFLAVIILGKLDKNQQN